MKKIARHMIGTVGFFLAGIAAFLGLREILGLSDESTEMRFRGYYELEEDTLDVVFVGNSHTYSYWQSAFAWDGYGIASSGLAVAAMPSSAVRNVAAEALRTQSPDVMVFDITPFAAADREENNSIYRLLDNMKLSLNYLDMAEGYCEYAGVEGLEEMEYYIPLLRFHSRWKELQKADFVQTRQSYLNSNYASKFLKRKLGKDAAHSATDVRAEIGQKNEAALRELLEWCGGQEMEVLFYAAPVLREDNLERMNRAGDIVEEYGFPFLNFNDEALYAKLGFDEGQDYGDKNHTNLNGSYKFTKALGNYLKETYGLADHRGEEAYASWDEKAEAYGALVGKYLAYGK